MVGIRHNFKDVKSIAKTFGFELKRKSSKFSLTGARRLGPNVGEVCSPCYFKTLKAVIKFLYEE